MIKKIKENLIMDNGFVRAYNDEVLFNGKIKGHYFKYSLSGRFPNHGVAIIPILNGRIVLADNYRYAINGYLTEIVKGMGVKGQTPLETAKMEVREEIGGVIENIQPIGVIQHDLSDIDLHCFVAHLTTLQEQELEETESIENIRTYTVDEIKDLLINNKIQDMTTISVLSLYLLNLK